MNDSILEIFSYQLAFPAYAKQILLSAVLGFVLGLEREWRGKVASLRTFSFICAGSCVFTVLSLYAAGIEARSPYDVTRVAAQVVSGIGFIGGGVIFKTTDRIEGITTAAMIWFAAGLGMACGFNKIGVVTWTFATYLGILFVSTISYRLIFFIRHQKSAEDGK